MKWLLRLYPRAWRRRYSDKCTPRSRSVLGFAAQEAGSLGHALIGTEHLLLGLLGEGEGLAASVLTELGTADPATVRRQILRALTDRPG